MTKKCSNYSRWRGSEQSVYERRPKHRSNSSTSINTSPSKRVEDIHELEDSISPSAPTICSIRTSYPVSSRRYSSVFIHNYYPDDDSVVVLEPKRPRAYTNLDVCSQNTVTAPQYTGQNLVVEGVQIKRPAVAVPRLVSPILC